jgi:hypothetical protein
MIKVLKSNKFELSLEYFQNINLNLIQRFKSRKLKIREFEIKGFGNGFENLNRKVSRSLDPRK